MLLTLDTSAAVSVALSRDGTILAARHRYEPRQHAELLSPFVAEVLSEAGARVGDITAVAVGQGPGPFTGLRVALVTARVLAAALGVPLHGVPSLDGLAVAANRLGLATGTEAIVATDARRKEVYWARYRLGDHLPQRLGEPAVSKALDVEVGQAVCLGRGCQLYPEALPPHPAALELLDPRAADLAQVATGELQAAPPRDPAPLYLRRPDATEPVRA